MSDENTGVSVESHPMDNPAEAFGFESPSDGSSVECPVCGANADNTGDSEFTCPECGESFTEN